MNRKGIFVLALLVAGKTDAIWAQDAAAVPEPEYVNQVFALGTGGKLEPLERAKLEHQSKTTNHFISVKATSSEAVQGKASPVRLSPDTHFIVRLYSGDIDPSTLVHLNAFAAKKNDRELAMYSAGGVIFAGTKGKSAQDTSVPISVTKYGSKSMQIAPSQPLAPGEYCFVSGMDANCFGVDAK